jgi:hypothetical protein
MKRKYSDENLQAAQLKQKPEELSILHQIWSNTGMLLFMLAAFTLLGGVLFVMLEAPHEQRTAVNILKDRSKFLHSLEELIMNASAKTVSEATATKVNGVKPLHPSPEIVRQAAYLLHQYEEALQSALASGYVLLAPNFEEDNVDSSAEENYQPQWNLWGSMYYCFTVYTTIGYGNMFPRTGAGQFASVIYGMLAIPLCLLVLARLGQVFNRGVKAIWRRLTCFIREKEPTTSGSISLWKLYNEANEQFDYPLPLAIALVCCYVWMGALMYSHWEKWNVAKAAYFTFVSLSTIGFGDVLPDDHRFFLFTSLYLFFGLALLSMLINAMVERLEGYLAYYKKAR